MKRTLCLILAALILAAMAPAVLADAGDKADTAIPIEPGKEVTGSLTSSNDHDYYRFTLSQPGYIAIDFSHEYVDSGSTYWKMDILDSKLQKYCTFLWNGDSFAQLTSWAIGLDAGTYYIHIYPYYHSSAVYKMTVRFQPTDAWEKEWNDTPVSATPILVNKEYSGVLMSNGDADCYQFSIPSDGFVNVGFSNEYVDSGSTYWKMEIFDAYNNVYLQTNYPGNSMVEKRICDIGLPAGTYYIRVKSYYWSSGEYRLNAHYEPSSAFETEPNNIPPKADPIVLNTWYGGALADDGDKDYYSFSVNGQNSVTVSFRHEYIDSGSTYWIVRIVDINQKEQLKISYSGNGALDSTSDPVKLAPGTYFVYVDDYYDDPQTYHLMVSVR